MTTETIGHRIRSLRIAKGWTQEYLGERLGCSRGNVARIENDYRPPSKQGVADLCVLFGVSERYLQTGREIEDGPVFRDGGGFQIIGKPKDRCSVQVYPETLAKVKSLARESGVTIPEALDQIVEYAIRNLKTP